MVLWEKIVHRMRVRRDCRISNHVDSNQAVSYHFSVDEVTDLE